MSQIPGRENRIPFSAPHGDKRLITRTPADMRKLDLEGRRERRTIFYQFLDRSAATGQPQPSAGQVIVALGFRRCHYRTIHRWLSEYNASKPGSRPMPKSVGRPCPRPLLGQLPPRSGHLVDELIGVLHVIGHWLADGQTVARRLRKRSPQVCPDAFTLERYLGQQGYRFFHRHQRPATAISRPRNPDLREPLPLGSSVWRSTSRRRRLLAACERTVTLTSRRITASLPRARGRRRPHPFADHLRLERRIGVRLKHLSASLAKAERTEPNRHWERGSAHFALACIQIGR